MDMDMLTAKYITLKRNERRMGADNEIIKVRSFVFCGIENIEAELPEVKF